jgi:hypothetical protein
MLCEQQFPHTIHKVSHALNPEAFDYMIQTSMRLFGLTNLMRA